MPTVIRGRAENVDVTSKINVDHYYQRVSPRLIIAEATQITLQGQCYSLTPGIILKSNRQVRNRFLGLNPIS